MNQNDSSKIVNPSSYLMFLVCIGILLFWRVLFFDFFIFDDAMHLSENKLIVQFSIDNLIKIWKTSLLAMTYTVWGILTEVTGVLNPLPFHGLNIFFHILNTILSFFIIKRVILLSDLNKKNVDLRFFYFFCFVGSLVFMIHPLKVEPIAWISSFKDILSTFWSFISIIFYLKSRDNELISRKKFYYSALCFVTFVLGLFSKQNVIILPLFFIFLDYFFLKLSLTSTLKKNIHFIIPGLIVAHFHLNILDDSFIFTSINYSGKTLLALETLRHYVTKFLFPGFLSFDYGLTPDFMLIKWQSGVLNKLGPLFTLFILVSVIFSYIKGKKEFLFITLGSFVILIFPTLGFIDFSFQNFSTAADRYFYLPSISLSILITYGLLSLNNYKKYIKVYVIIIFIPLLSYYLKTNTQINLWSKPELIVKNTLELNPNSYPLNITYGFLQKKNGNLKEAAIYYERALALKPFMQEPRSHLEDILTQLGRTDLVEKLKIKNFLLDIKKELDLKKAN